MENILNIYPNLHALALKVTSNNNLTLLWQYPDALMQHPSSITRMKPSIAHPNIKWQANQCSST